jgi:hypothetical protein
MKLQHFLFSPHTRALLLSGRAQLGFGAVVPECEGKKQHFAVTVKPVNSNPVK